MNFNQQLIWPDNLHITQPDLNTADEILSLVFNFLWLFLQCDEMTVCWKQKLLCLQSGFTHNYIYFLFSFFFFITKQIILGSQYNIQLYVSSTFHHTTSRMKSSLHYMFLFICFASNTNTYIRNEIIMSVFKNDWSFSMNKMLQVSSLTIAAIIEWGLHVQIIVFLTGLYLNRSNEKTPNWYKCSYFFEYSRKTYPAGNNSKIQVWVKKKTNDKV